MEYTLKPGMLLGAATAATQIEGGDQNNNWYDWYRRGYIKDNSDPSVATMHYDRWQEDLDLMADMGIQCYRFGLEWSRIEPQEGVFSQEALDHYREEIAAMKARGIRPLLTLHHFSNPLWLEEKGAFLDSDNITYYLRYVHKVVEALGDLVEEYITINEPNVYAFNSYFAGAWPPGKQSFLAMSRVMTNLTAAHIEAYGLIRKTRHRWAIPAPRSALPTICGCLSLGTPKIPFTASGRRSPNSFSRAALPPPCAGASALSPSGSTPLLSPVSTATSTL